MEAGTSPARTGREREEDCGAEGWSRRELVRAGLAGTAALGLAGAARAGAGTGSGDWAARYASERDPLLHLIHRASQGYTPALHQRALELGAEAWLEEQLDPASIDDSGLDAILAQMPTLWMSARELYDNFWNGGSHHEPIVELRNATILRAVLSGRQLYERVVELWTDHFTVYHLDEWTQYLKTVDDREVIRAHALGTFPELLSASAHSAAMLYYLDNHTSHVDAPNENYARELLELHTLSVNGLYTEDDVRDVARCYTGWKFYDPEHPDHGEFWFDAAVHDDGPKHVLGVDIPAGGGVTDGETVLSILATHPDTAAFVALKLCRWFLGYEPPQAVLDQVAGTYLATGGDIKAMLRVVLGPTGLAAAPFEASAKLKRPFHFAMSLLRGLDADISSANGIWPELDQMAQTPFMWPRPDGYPDKLEEWSGTLLSRWTFAQRLLDGEIPGTQVDAAAVLNQEGPVGRGKIAGAIDRLLTGGTLAPYEVARVQAYVDAAPALTDQLVRDAFSLIGSGPGFQLY